jgi:hypothetical protein
MSATPPEASTEYSRGSGASQTGGGPSAGRSAALRAGVLGPFDPGLSGALRAAILGAGLLGAVLLFVAEFTPLYTISSSTSSTALKSVSTGSHDSYALIPIAVVAGALAYGAAVRGSRPALLALGVLGIATLLIALVGDLPDARATGVVGSSATHFASAAASPQAGLFLETVGAIALLASSVCGLLLGGPAPTRRAPASGS